MSVSLRLTVPPHSLSFLKHSMRGCGNQHRKYDRLLFLGTWAWRKLISSSNLLAVIMSIAFMWYGSPPPIGCLTNTSLTTVATNERSHLLALFRTGHGRSYLYVLGINYKRPGGWEEFEQAQKDGTGVKPARYNQPAGEEERDDQANKPSMKYTVSCTGNA